MKILLLGDIVGTKTVDYLSKNLWSLRKKFGADAVIANGENATDIMGLSNDDAKTLLDSGIDVLTGGNHIFHNKSLYSMLDDSKYIIRPLNLPSAAPGNGVTIFEASGKNILVLNLVGMMGMDHSQNPFEAADRALRQNDGKYDFAIVDLHAEATAEKQAMGYYLAGRAAVVFGTHTHVQTADECILEGGTAYITDLGMCGSANSVLGVESECVIKALKTGLPTRFKTDDNNIKLDGCVFEIDEKTGLTVSVEAVSIC